MIIHISLCIDERTMTSRSRHVTSCENIYFGGIRLCDSLEFVTSEKNGKLAQNKTRKFYNSSLMTDYFDKRIVSMIFFFNLCHDNDCQSHSN